MPDDFGPGLSIAPIGDRKHMDIWEKLGLSGKRVIIINHDDLGYFEGINRAYWQSPYLTGSIIIPSPWSAEFGYCKRIDADLGVHLTLTSEFQGFRLRPLTAGRSLCDSSGYYWSSVEEVWSNVIREEAEAEFRAQIQTALLMGVDVTHVDSHMSVALHPDFAKIYLRLLLEYGLPGLLPENYRAAWYYKWFPELEPLISSCPLPKVRLIDTYGIPQEVKRDGYIDILSKLTSGVYHLNHHAACRTPETEHLPDIDLRVADSEVLIDQEVLKVLSEFQIISYKEIRNCLREYL